MSAVPPQADTGPVDAFIIFNEQEGEVANIVQMLENHGISTYFWRRDIAIGEPWSGIEETRLAQAKTAVVFLGNAGWGSTHRRLTESAWALRKRIIPVLIGNPQPSDFSEVHELFSQLRYLDMRDITDAGVSDLAYEIRRDPAQDPRPFAGTQASSEDDGRKLAQVDRIISVLIDGNEEERAWALRQVQTSPLVDKQLLSARLRVEIQSRFSATVEHQIESASRDPKTFPSIRSWMFSCLIWADGEGEESRDLILHNLSATIEADRNVRFWILAGLYLSKSSYLGLALDTTASDDSFEVSLLRFALERPEDVVDRMREMFLSSDVRNAWSGLRVLRIIAIPELVDDVCRLFLTTPTESSTAYDALYALSNPGMAPFAAKILAENPGLEEVVKRVVTVATISNRTAKRSFCTLLAAFDTKRVEELLKQAEGDRKLAGTARALRLELSEILKTDRSDVFIPGYASDVIDIRNESLEIQEDVKTLVAVILAKEVHPPLAVGLFGDWGTGKSFFMQSMKAAANDLAKRSVAPDSKFCSNIVQIEFNAWHYIDANLWASLVSYILEQLAAYVSPEISEEEREAVLLKELSTAKSIVAEAEAEKATAQKIIDERQTKLQDLQVKREQAEVKLSDLRASDLANILLADGALKTELETSLKEVGAPVALDKVSDLSDAVAEAHSLHGRAVALVLAVTKGKNQATIWVLLLVILVAVPLLAFGLHWWLGRGDLLVSLTAFVTQVTALIAGATVILRKALTVANGALTRIENAKQQVDQALADKRKTPSKEEKDLVTEIAGLRVQEQEARARLTAAAARVVELETQIQAINEGRSLAKFLGERVRSEDYRKHLGLISTIRRDFESLATRLKKAQEKPEKGFRAADRIILYIDDLDRLPENKVMDVLQAVHLLLAYQLFVVVVGVDPRWLLHSLSSTYGAFNNDANKSETWRTTPQNYLEKIFQIPFSLRPMTDTGYGRLVSKLLGNEAAAPVLQPRVDGERTSFEPRRETQTGGGSQSNGNPNTDNTLNDEEQRDPHDDAQRDPQPEQPKTETKGEFEIQDEALVINEWEARFAVRLYSFIPSPRAAKRFSNIYRILKAHVRPEQLRQFEGTAELPGDFQIPMLLLAMLIGTPDESALLFPKLQKAAAEKKDVLNVFHCLKDAEKVKTWGFDPVAAASLSAKLEPVINDGAFPNGAEVFHDWLPRVARFSFDVGRIVQPFGTANVSSSSESLPA